MLHSRGGSQIQINSLLGIGLHVESDGGVSISILGEDVVSPKEPFETGNLFKVNVLGNLSPETVMVSLWPGQDKVINIDREKQLLARNPIGAGMRLNPLGAPLLGQFVENSVLKVVLPMASGPRMPV